MTTSLLIAALLHIGFLWAHVGRTTVLLTLSYLALRRSAPAERKEILEALGPVLGATQAKSQCLNALVPRSTEGGLPPGPCSSLGPRHRPGARA